MNSFQSNGVRRQGAFGVLLMDLDDDEDQKAVAVAAVVVARETNDQSHLLTLGLLRA